MRQPQPRRQEKKSAPLTWLIDLDNTLHNANYAIFPAIHENMNAYMARLLGDGKIPAAAEVVDSVRMLYWKKYGATLLGLIKHHNVDSAEFLQQAHHIEHLPEMMRFETGLKKWLHKLPGRKILFTNAPHVYAQRVVRHLGLKHHFDQCISIEAMRVHGQLRPKPSRWLLKKLVAKNKLSFHQCVLVEDTRENLKTAKQLGMKTAWVTQYINEQQMKGIQRFARAGYIDVKVRSIQQLPVHFSRLSLHK